MRERLFKMIKAHGVYCRFDNQLGYVYSLELCSGINCILIEVAFKDAESITILDARISQSQLIQAVV